MTTLTVFGWYHILWLLLTVGATVLLCVLYKRGKIKNVAGVVAVLLNELAVVVGIVPGETFNMFFVSRHCEPSLPVYSSVQAVVPYPWCLFIYVAGFTAASYIMLLIAMLIKKLAHKKKVAWKSNFFCFRGNIFAFWSFI